MTIVRAGAALELDRRTCLGKEARLWPFAPLLYGVEAFETDVSAH